MILLEVIQDNITVLGVFATIITALISLVVWLVKNAVTHIQSTQKEIVNMISLCHKDIIEVKANQK